MATDSPDNFDYKEMLASGLPGTPIKQETGNELSKHDIPFEGCLLEEAYLPSPPHLCCAKNMALYEASMVANMLETSKGQPTIIPLENFRPQVPCCTTVHHHLLTFYPLSHP